MDICLQTNIWICRWIKSYTTPTSKHQLSCQLSCFLSFLLSYSLSNLLLTTLTPFSNISFVLNEVLLLLSILMEPLVYTTITCYFALCSFQGPWELQPWARSWAPCPLQHSSRNQRCRVKSRHFRAKGELKEPSCTILQSQNNKVWVSWRKYKFWERLRRCMVFLSL